MKFHVYACYCPIICLIISISPIVSDLRFYSFHRICLYCNIWSWFPFLITICRYIATVLDIVVVITLIHKSSAFTISTPAAAATTDPIQIDCDSQEDSIVTYPPPLINIVELLIHCTALCFHTPPSGMLWLFFVNLFLGGSKQLINLCFLVNPFVVTSPS